MGNRREVMWIVSRVGVGLVLSIVLGFGVRGSRRRERVDDCGSFGWIGF